MLVFPQKVKIKCTPNNKKHLLSKGYSWTYNQYIFINADDLSDGSNTDVDVICDYCLENGISKVFKKRYDKYTRSRKVIAKDCCNDRNCMEKKKEEANLIKFGVRRPSQLKEFAEKSASKRRTPFAVVRQLFNERGYLLLEENYINSEQNLKYICLKHEEKGVQDITLASLKNGVGCYFCGNEQKSLKTSGENSHLWKGGITEINYYLRGRIEKWKSDSRESCNYRCVITGEKNALAIHHLYSFNKILEETFLELNLPLHKTINEYSSDELRSIEETLLRLHYKYPLGVCLREDIHKQFHMIYGREDNTPEQFQEFANRYFNLNENIVLYGNVSSPYFLYKKNASSKYKGVTFNKKLNKWDSTFHLDGKKYYIGTFDTEAEAAYWFNQKSIESLGDCIKINLLTESDQEFIDINKNKLTFSLNKKRKKSIYRGVSQCKKSKRWIAQINVNKVHIPLGRYDTEKEAAIAYNQKAIELFGENSKKLNKIV